MLLFLSSADRYNLRARRVLKGSFSGPLFFFALQTYSRSYNRKLFEDTKQVFLIGDAQWILVNYKKNSKLIYIYMIVPNDIFRGYIPVDYCALDTIVIAYLFHFQMQI